MLVVYEALKDVLGKTSLKTLLLNCVTKVVLYFSLKWLARTMCPISSNVIQGLAFWHPYLLYISLVYFSMKEALGIMEEVLKRPNSFHKKEWLHQTIVKLAIENDRTFAID